MFKKNKPKKDIGLDGKMPKPKTVDMSAEELKKLQDVEYRVQGSLNQLGALQHQFDTRKNQLISQLNNLQVDYNKEVEYILRKHKSKHPLGRVRADYKGKKLILM